VVHEKIVDRIRKMINLRDDKAASQGEIENAATLIQKLLFEHNLTIEEIGSEEKYNKFTFNPDQKKREGTWISQLYNIIAKHNFCFVIISPKHDNPNDRQHQSFYIHIVGKESDVEVVEYFCEWLIPKIRRMSEAAWNNYQGHEKRGKFTRGYLMGCTVGIYKKLESEKERIREASDDSRALVLKRDAELKNAISKMYPNLKTSRLGESSSRDGRAQGYVDGRNMSLSKGVETRGNRLIG